MTGLHFQKADEDDIYDWWDNFDKRGASHTNESNKYRNKAVFLYGWVSDDSGAEISGKVMIGPDTEVIFPLINSVRDTQQEAEEDIDKMDKYADINENDETSNCHRISFRRGSRYYDGYWVNVKGLQSGDVIKFGGKGRNGFFTDAKYTVQ